MKYLMILALLFVGCQMPVDKHGNVIGAGTILVNEQDPSREAMVIEIDEMSRYIHISSTYGKFGMSLGSLKSGSWVKKEFTSHIFIADTAEISAFVRGGKDLVIPNYCGHETLDFKNVLLETIDYKLPDSAIVRWRANKYDTINLEIDP